MKLYTLDELKDRDLCQIGTPERDEFEAQVKEDLYAYQIGVAIKQVRLQNNLTQEQLGARIGVKKSQISKLERGKSATISTLSRVFKALGISSASLDLGQYGKVALW